MSRDAWKRQQLRLRQRPVVRVCLGLVAAFVCGIVLGVGIAAVIAPGPAANSVADASGPDVGAPKDGEPVVAVSVREEKTTGRRRPLSLVDIDPISHAEAAPKPPPAPTHVAPKVPAEKASFPPPTAAPAEAGDAGKPAPAIAQPESAAPEPVHTGPAVPAAVDAATADTPSAPYGGSDVSEHTPAPDRPVSGDDGKSATKPVAVDGKPAQKSPAAPSTPSGDVSFEGARSVAEASRVDAVPRAHVALGPLWLKTVPPGDGTAAPEATAPQVTPDSDGTAEGGTAEDVALPPHPPAKNLQLAALPMLHTDAWIRNAVTMPDKPRDAMIAMIIDDMGIDQKRSKAMIRLPAPLTLSFIPYGYHLHELVAAARAAGHEIMLHQPMEPIDSEADPGPNALRTTVSIEENRRRLLWSFSRVEGIVGLNNHMGSRYTAWQEGMEMVMEEVSERGLLFVDSITNNESVAFRVAREHKLPSAHRDVFIDHDISQEAIENRLLEIERIARRRGHAVAIAHPHDLTREALKTWILDAQARGFDFVPISHIVRRTMKSG